MIFWLAILSVTGNVDLAPSCIACGPLTMQLSNSASFAHRETRPLSKTDSEVGQEPRGWELGRSHRGASWSQETEVENTVSRIGLKLQKTDVLLTKQRYETNVWPNMDICDCQVRSEFQCPRIFGRMWCNCMKEIFLLMKYFMFFFFLQNPQMHLRSPKCFCVLSGRLKTITLFLKIFGIIVSQRFDKDLIS